MKQHFQYLKYVLRHKWFVFLACLELRVPLWIAILHDWDKFLPDEWFPYVNHFHGDRREKTPAGTGYIHLPGDDSAFDFAVDLHCRRNKHHWQWWVFAQNGGSDITREMPHVFRREMLADWRGAGRAQGTSDTRAWYLSNKDRMRIHPMTRTWIEKQLDVVKFPIGTKVWCSMDNCAWPGVVLNFWRNDPNLLDPNEMCYQVEMIPNPYTRADNPLWMYEGGLSIATDEEIAAEAEKFNSLVEVKQEQNQ